MLKKSKQLEKEMKGIQDKLKKMPEGKLICSHTGPYCKWERSDGHKKTYIPKKDRALAEKKKEKKYLSALWNDLKHEKDAIDLYKNAYYLSKSKLRTKRSVEVLNRLLGKNLKYQKEYLIFCYIDKTNHKCYNFIRFVKGGKLWKGCQ